MTNAQIQPLSGFVRNAQWEARGKSVLDLAKPVEGRPWLFTRAAQCQESGEGVARAIACLPALVRACEGSEEGREALRACGLL